MVGKKEQVVGEYNTTLQLFMQYEDMDQAESLYSN